MNGFEFNFYSPRRSLRAQRKTNNRLAAPDKPEPIKKISLFHALVDRNSAVSAISAVKSVLFLFTAETAENAEKN
jgi:hypothetical protein